MPFLTSCQINLSENEILFEKQSLDEGQLLNILSLCHRIVKIVQTTHTQKHTLNKLNAYNRRYRYRKREMTARDKFFFYLLFSIFIPSN